jgi:hypothetical protein
MTPTPADRAARLEALRDRLRPLVDQAVEQMAEELLDTPDEQLFGEIEYRLRDQAHRLAAAAHQAGLAGRKKGATKARASTAPAATPTPASSPTAAAPS